MLLLVIISPLFAMAQDPGPCPDCPIDGGLALLIAAGAGYGIKKYREQKIKIIRKTENTTEL